MTENRARVADCWARSRERLITIFQKHSADAVVADRPWQGRQAPEADAIVTAKRAGHRHPDRRLRAGAVCEREARVIGAAHAGWRGALSGIVEATVAAMTKLGAKPSASPR